MTPHETFRVDNRIMQNVPALYATQRRKDPDQLYLPGMEPFGPFDMWATFALYCLLDPKDPTAPVRATPTQLLEVLSFARKVSDALAGYSSFQSDDYRLVEDALQRLYTYEVHIRNCWEVRTGKQGRREKQWVEYYGRILVSYAYAYPPGVTPASMLPQGKRRNVNRTKTLKGEPGPPIWREVSGPRPVGIEYRLAPDLVNGLTGKNPNIGATILPIRIFSLRKTLGPYPVAIRLLVWVCRQTSRRLTRRLDGLAGELNIRGKDKTRNRDTLRAAFDLLKTSGVIETPTFFEKNGESMVTFAKTSDWHFARLDSEDTSLHALPGGPEE